MKGYVLLEAEHTPQVFKRLSSANFTWSILEYFVPYILVMGQSQQ